MDDWPVIAALADDVRAGRVSAVANVERAIKNIEADEKCQAIITIILGRSKERADRIDAMVKEGKDPGRLAGVPFIAKDNFLAFGGQTTAASNILNDFGAPFQATAIERLEAEGAICVAKANLDAFAHGGSTENSDFFTTHNPHDESRVPGGSSGGSAAAVALKFAPFALGTDTGGSIRNPASYCGVVGYKPTYGLVSRSGVVAMGSSLDTIGPLALNVEDAALVMDVVSGRDPLDSTTIEKDQSGYANVSGLDLHGRKIGVVKEFMGEGLEEGVRAQITKAIDALKQAGAEIEEVSIPALEFALAVYYIICPAEISSNLSRYDGQRYGYSDPDAKNLDESYELSRSKGFGAEAKRRIMIGTYVLSSGYYDAYYKKAQTVRTKLINEFNEVFAKYDFLLGPTVPTTAFKIGENTADPLKMYLNDIMTVAANLVGTPSVSLPCGTSNGLPVGLQLMAPQRKDRQLLELSKTFEGLGL